ncbi:transcriptional regulator [Virgisporangium aliadipatigenens]|uniref:Transcriptional regulator n=1 Tax=Virgisporangium aliadipatigenens TaxID=741659 RepID=A0A8J4DRH8_9ACTN|nr:transcriptional regulator [Virgisporangium aliadipatigenens]
MDGLPLDRLPTHRHDGPMLSWSETATVTFHSGRRSWIVPPGHGMWVPGGAPHGVEVLRAGLGSALLFDPARRVPDWREPTAFVVSPLVRALVRHLSELDGPVGAARERAEAVLFDVLRPADALTIPLPMPADARLRGIAERLLADPGDGRELAHWAVEVGAGVRTIGRLFVAETGMTFGRWRTHARIRAAVPMLAEGVPVGTVSRRVGFRKAAAFTDAFRRVTRRLPSSLSGERP